MMYDLAVFFFFNETATTEIYTLSLHDALPILTSRRATSRNAPAPRSNRAPPGGATRSSRTPDGGIRSRGAPDGRSRGTRARSEEHTSELQSRQYLVCRLLLEKKKACVAQTLTQ